MTVEIQFTKEELEWVAACIIAARTRKDLVSPGAFDKQIKTLVSKISEGLKKFRLEKKGR